MSKLKKVFKKIKKIAIPVAIAAAAFYTGGAALGAVGAAGAASTTALSSGAIGLASGGSIFSLSSGAALSSGALGLASKGSLFNVSSGGFGGVLSTLKSAGSVAQSVSAVSGLLGPSGKAEAVRGGSTAVSGSQGVATRSAAEVEEEERKRRAMASASARSNTIRAGALASRPSLASAGLLG